MKTRYFLSFAAKNRERKNQCTHTHTTHNSLSFSFSSSFQISCHAHLDQGLPSVTDVSLYTHLQTTAAVVAVTVTAKTTMAMVIRHTNSASSASKVLLVESPLACDSFRFNFTKVVPAAHQKENCCTSPKKD